MKEKPDVLIVGAGPTCLILALELDRLGVPFKLIDKANGPITCDVSGSQSIGKLQKTRIALEVQESVYKKSGSTIRTALL